LLVHDVPVELCDAVVTLMESERKGGGEIEQQKRDDITGTMLVTFNSQHGQSSVHSQTSCSESVVCCMTT